MGVCVLVTIDAMFLTLTLTGEWTKALSKKEKKMRSKQAPEEPRQERKEEVPRPDTKPEAVPPPPEPEAPAQEQRAKRTSPRNKKVIDNLLHLSSDWSTGERGVFILAL